ncbi:MAG: rhodanese-like domain-containing protein [Flavobacteriales bacterium]|nr:rhodanese-like domain-containing protein [Flavobacteriales bacterium]
MKNIRFFFLFAVAAFAISCSDAQTTGSADYTVAQAKTAVEKGGITILDVRTPQEFAAGHIKGAVNIDWYQSDFATKVASLDKTKPVLVYCAVGGRSSKAKTKLNALGFKEVHNMTGGMDAWNEAKYPVE